MDFLEIVKSLKRRCFEIYTSLEKDEDGFLFFKNENSENEFLYLKEMVYNECVVREINAIKFEDDVLLLWENDREDYYTMGVYEESEYEIFSKLYILLYNQL